MNELDRMKRAVAEMYDRVESSVTTMVCSDVRTLLRLAHDVGYMKAKQERLADIELFKGKDDDEH